MHGIAGKLEQSQGKKLEEKYRKGVHCRNKE